MTGQDPRLEAAQSYAHRLITDALDGLMDKTSDARLIGATVDGLIGGLAAWLQANATAETAYLILQRHADAAAGSVLEGRS